MIFTVNLSGVQYNFYILSESALLLLSIHYKHALFQKNYHSLYK